MNSESQERSHAAIERGARETFESSVAGLDGTTLSRLNRSRQQALAAASPGSIRRAPSRMWWPAGALAATALIAVLVLRTSGTFAPTAPLAADVDPDLQQEPLVLLAAGEDMELATAAELEFYAWVDVETADDGHT